jgi:hypothetical protein
MPAVLKQKIEQVVDAFVLPAIVFITWGHRRRLAPDIARVAVFDKADQLRAGPLVALQDFFDFGFIASRLWQSQTIVRRRRRSRSHRKTMHVQSMKCGSGFQPRFSRRS